MKIYHAYITNRFLAVIMFVVIFCLFFLAVNALWIPEVGDLQFALILLLLVLFDTLISYYLAKWIAARKVEGYIATQQLHIKWRQHLFLPNKPETIIRLIDIQTFEYRYSGGKYRSVEISYEHNNEIILRGRSLPFANLSTFDELAKSIIGQCKAIKEVPVIAAKNKGNLVPLAQLIVDILSFWN